MKIQSFKAKKSHVLQKIYTYMLHLHEEVFWMNQKRLILQKCKGNTIASAGHMTCHQDQPIRSKGEGRPEAIANITPEIIEKPQMEGSDGEKKQWQVHDSECSCCSGNKAAKILEHPPPCVLERLSARTQHHSLSFRNCVLSTLFEKNKLHANSSRKPGPARRLALQSAGISQQVIGFWSLQNPRKHSVQAPIWTQNSWVTWQQ